MAAELYEVREYEKVEPCSQTYESTRPACRSGDFYMDVYRAKPDSDMKRSGMELKHGSFAGFIPARELFFYKKTQKTRVAKRGEIGYTGGKLLV